MAKFKVLLCCGLLTVGLAGCGDDDTSEPAKVPSGSTPQATKITIDNFEFAPASFSTKQGSTVVINNQDSATHTFTLDDDSVDSGNIASGTTKTVTAPGEVGSYKYHCEIHSSMTGTLVVK